MNDVFKIACKEFDVRESLVKAARKEQNICMCRYAIAGILFHEFNLDRDFIASVFGKTKPAIIYIVKQYDILIKTDKIFRDKVNSIKGQIEHKKIKELDYNSDSDISSRSLLKGILGEVIEIKNALKIK